MQSASSKIWTRVAVSISYDDNHYITGTSQKDYKEYYLNIYFKYTLFYSMYEGDAMI